MTSISAFQFFSVSAFCVGSPTEARRTDAPTPISAFRISAFQLLLPALTTIGEIQRVTGLKFLPKLTAAKRAELENFKAAALWSKE